MELHMFGSNCAQLMQTLKNLPENASQLLLL